MTGREWQTGFYLRDRWRPNEKLTVSAGLRLQDFPLMSRATHGIEVLDYNSYIVSIGGLGSVPQDVGLKLQEWYFEPRLGAAYRLDEKTVMRAGYGWTTNPLPVVAADARVVPLRHQLQRNRRALLWLRDHAGERHPAGGDPGLQLGTGEAAGGRLHAVAQHGHRGLPRRGLRPRSREDPAVEHRVRAQAALDLSAEIAYVGTPTDGGYADLNVNYGEPGGGNAARKYFASAGTTTISDWAARTKSRYQGLQVALNRPFRNGLMLKGAYTWSQSKNMTANDEDGWTTLNWNHPLVFDKNFSYAGFDRTHVFQMGWVYELPFLKQNTQTLGKILGGWQVNGIFAFYTGTPFSITGTNNALNCQGCGNIFINVQGEPEPTGTKGSMTELWYDKSLFAQPTGLGKDGFGTSARNQFRRPSIWNVDFSLFKAFQIGHVRPELRIEAANIFNHTNWGAPILTYTANNFMQFTPASTNQVSANTGDIPGARRIQIGLRVGF